jgi:hypothetical protein
MEELWCAMRPQRDDFVPMGTMRFYSDVFFWLSSYCANRHMQMTGDSHCFSEKEDDTTQAPYPHICRSRPKVSDIYRSSDSKSQQLPVYNKTTTLHTYKLIDFLVSILTHQTVATPSVLGLSCLLLSLPLFPMLPPYLWSSLRSFPIPWPCLLPFHCKSSFYILFYISYFACLLSHYLSVV